MSGGVDSCVAASLLQEEGFAVVGATLKLWCYGERPASSRACCSLEAIRDARSFAARFGFPHFVLDYESLFRERVVAPFVEEYLAGRTPYPCAACNADLKFGRLLVQARAMGARWLATGHYARVGMALLPDGGEEPALFRAADREKDQSYALWAVSRDALPYLRLPLGRLTKRDVRERAHHLGFAALGEKPESQDLCFVGGARRHAAYLEEEVGAEIVRRPGPMLDADGRVVGTHRGLAHYTVGQRRGLGLESSARQYVIDLDPVTNVVRVGPDTELYASEAFLGPVNWLSSAPPRAGQPVLAQIRYRQSPVAAGLWPRDDARARSGEPFDAAGGARLAFETPVRAVAPGQSAVLYDGDRLLGGGAIDRGHRFAS